VAIYASHAQAEDATRELQRSGFNLRKLSIVGVAISRKSMSSAATAPAPA
jgi:hypothetical protein